MQNCEKTMIAASAKQTENERILPHLECIRAWEGEIQSIAVPQPQRPSLHDMTRRRVTANYQSSFAMEHRLPRLGCGSTRYPKYWKSLQNSSQVCFIPRQI